MNNWHYDIEIGADGGGSEFFSLNWASKPLIAGWYWVYNDKELPRIVHVLECTDGFCVEVAGRDNLVSINTFSHWMGALPFAPIP